MKPFFVIVLLVAGFSTAPALADETKTFEGSYSQENASEEFLLDVAYAEAAFKAITAGYDCPEDYKHNISKTRRGKPKAEVEVTCKKRTVFSDDIVISGTILPGHKIKRVYSVMFSLTEDAFRCATWTPISWLGVKYKELSAEVIIDETQKTFTATFSGKKIDMLKYSYCRYQGVDNLEQNTVVESVNENGEVVELELSAFRKN